MAVPRLLLEKALWLLLWGPLLLLLLIGPLLGYLALLMWSTALHGKAHPWDGIGGIVAVEVVHWGGFGLVQDRLES
jgi:hypothetical protein